MGDAKHLGIGRVMSSTWAWGSVTLSGTVGESGRAGMPLGQRSVSDSAAGVTVRWGWGGEGRSGAIRLMLSVRRAWQFAVSMAVVVWGSWHLTVRARQCRAHAALCRAVMPSRARKSMWAPPKHSVRITSTEPSVWAASVRGVSEWGTGQSHAGPRPRAGRPLPPTEPPVPLPTS